MARSLSWLFTGPPTRPFLRLAWICVVATTLANGGRAIYHVADGTDRYLRIPQDDFFYYAVVARNLATTGQLSFDGFTLTTGFHPLWQGILTLCALASGGTGPLFFLLLTLVQIGLVLLLFHLLARLLDRLRPGHWLAAPAAAAATMIGVGPFFEGMEIVLVTPLMVLLLLLHRRLVEEKSPPLRDEVLYGLVASLTILARLDAITLVALLLVLRFVLPGRPERPFPRLALVGLGGLLLPLYLLFNLAVTGSMMPTSGQAKGLLSDVGFSLMMLTTIPVTPPLIVTAILALLLLLELLRRGLTGRALFMSIGERQVVVSLLLFPLLFLLVQGLRSDWRLWSWYLYWMVPVLAVLLVEVTARAEQFTAPRSLPAWGRIALVLLLFGRYLAVTADQVYHATVELGPPGDSFYGHAGAIRRFGATHTGIYGMGDRAGLPAFMLEQPVIQLEGLVADQEMLRSIEREEPLGEVLNRYRVDYFVVSQYEPIDTTRPCHHFEAPTALQAGERSRRMKGEICGPPIYAYTAEGKIYTYIFAISERARRRAAID